MVMTPLRAGIALLLAAGLVARTDDEDNPTAADTSTTGTGAGDLETAFEFAECMRDNGIEDFPDPQIRADGDYSLEPPVGSGRRS
jgi:hypothetical protein